MRRRLISRRRRRMPRSAGGRRCLSVESRLVRLEAIMCAFVERRRVISCLISHSSHIGRAVKCHK
jgi:hypothetical protein